MSRETNKWRQGRIILMAVGSLLFIAGSAQLGMAQPTSDSSDRGGLERKHPHLLPGKMLAKGDNTTFAGTHKLLTYELEEVTLPTPEEYTVRGQRQRLQSLLRLSITGEFKGGDYIIWIDDKALKGVASVGLNKLSVFILDRSVLRDGAALAVALRSEEYELFPLPERLKLPDDVKATIPGPPAPEPGDEMFLRSLLVVTGKSPQPYIVFTATSHRRFPIMNSSIYLHIGRYAFLGGISSNRSSATFSLTPAEFAKLKNGERMIVNYSEDAPNQVNLDGWDFGPLDKSMLDR